MSGQAGIAWTDATWNPVIYYSGQPRLRPLLRRGVESAVRLFQRWPRRTQNAAQNVVLHPERLDEPLHWRKPRRVFVCSMADLFLSRCR